MTADTQDLPPAGARRAHGNLRAIAIMCLASLCFIAMHSFIKSVRGDVPVAVILWSQYAFQAAILTVLFARRLPLMVSSHMLGLQILRALLLLATVGAMFVAVGLMQLADAIAIGFVAPLLITALSVVFLKERVGLAHWLAILVGFAGMLVIIRPGAGVFDPAALVPLAAAVFAACYQTLTRPIARSVEPSRMLYMATLTGLAASSVALPFFWQTPTVVQLAFLLAAACLGAASHFLLIKAYQGAPASVVAPFSYSELIWAATLGFAVFGDVPEATTVVGGMVLAASGLYLFRRGHAESTG